MFLTLEAERVKPGKVTLRTAVQLAERDMARPVDGLTEAALLLHGAAMVAMNDSLVKFPHQHRLTCTVDEADARTGSAGNVHKAVQDILQRVQPSSHTPPEREALRVDLKAAIIRQRAAAGFVTR